MTSPLVLHDRSWRRSVVRCALLAALVPARAFGEEQVELDWQAPPECPQRAAVQQKLRSLAGEAWRTTERVRAKGRIERVERRYRLTLTVRDGATVKERTIESDSCVDLGGAAAVTLGLLLGRAPKSAGTDTDRAAATGTSGSTTPGDTTTGGPGSEGTPSGDANERRSGTGAAGASKAAASTKESSSATTKDSSTKSPAADETHDDEGKGASDSNGASTRTWRALVRAPLLTLDLLRLPKPSVGIGGGLGVRYAEWRFVANGRILSDQTLWSTQYPPEYPHAGARLSRVTGEVSACRGWRNGRLEFSPCVTIGLDHLTIRGEGPPNIARQTQHSMAALLGGSGSAHVYLAEWMAIFAGAGVAVATSAPTLTIAGLGEIGHVGAVQVSVGIGPEWIF